MPRIDPDATLQIMSSVLPRAGELERLARPPSMFRAVQVRHEPEHFILLDAPDEADFALELVVNDPLISVRQHAGGPWGTLLELHTEPPAVYMVTGFDQDYGTLQCRKVERIPEPASPTSSS